MKKPSAKRGYMGKKETFKGRLKQTEGYTPKSAMPSKKKAGGRIAKAREAREARLEDVEM